MTEPADKPLEQAKTEFVAERRGNYATNLEYVLSRWQSWCHDRDIHSLAEVTPIVMRRYATHLAQRADADAIAATTARTYYNYVSALLTRSVEVGDLAENPAEKRTAQKPLPSGSTSSGDQQFWSPEQRRAIVTHVDDRAREAIDDPDSDPFAAVRDRALVTVLAYTGVRGSEVLADSRHPDRNGLRWGDVDLETGVLSVRGKSGDDEEVGLPGQTHAPLERLHTVLESPPDSWPVFPSRHPPSLYSAIDAAGHDPPDANPWGHVLETGIEPPAMTTSGARSLMQRLSGAADVPGLEEGEYLTLHGARRGVGETLYRERGHVAAQRTLRHADPTTTSEMYSHIEASELAADNTTVFDEE